jgi:hypothetical protein
MPAPETMTGDRSQIVTYDGVEFVVDDNPELKSTWGQRATVASSALASALLLAQGINHGHSAVATGLAMLAGYIFAGKSLSIDSCESEAVVATVDA